MKTSYLFLTLLFASLILFMGQKTQDNSSNWNQNPAMIRVYPAGEYSDLPQNKNFILNTLSRTISVENDVFTISPNIRVHPSAGTQSETPIVRHPFNQSIMFGSANTFRGGTTISTGVYVTTNGGFNWFGSDTLNNGGFNYGDPGPVIDKNGRFLISYITLSGNIGVSYSTNLGITWTPPVSLPGGTTGADKNLSGTDDSPASIYYGRSYIVYTEFSGAYLNRIVSSFTTNGGISWSSVAPVSPVPSAVHHHQGCDIRTGQSGEVYVVWANCTTNGQNSTEDSLGFAISTNGGVSWSTSTNNAYNINGIRTSNLFNGIRANGFPRIDIDRTGGPRNGWIYVVTAEKHIAPASDAADIIMHRSTNSGISWTASRINQDAAGNGKYQYMPVVRVDEYGGVNVIYYDTRNTTSNDSAQIYVARSTDGGNNWSEILVSDHKFKPKSISGLATGYQGDYIGITSGNAKIWPYWCEDITGKYQAWTSSIDIGFDSLLSEEFTETTFPPEYWTLQYSGTNFWSRNSVSSYGIGSGSAKFSFWDAPGGTVQSLISPTFSSTASGDSLKFDHAYAPYTVGTDSLIIETSTNSGTSFSTLARLHGNASGGSLNTAPVSTTIFTPTSLQWATKNFLLPPGTNKIKFRTSSGFGNNLFLDDVQDKNPPPQPSPDTPKRKITFINKEKDTANDLHIIFMNGNVTYRGIDSTSFTKDTVKGGNHTLTGGSILKNDSTRGEFLATAGGNLKIKAWWWTKNGKQLGRVKKDNGAEYLACAGPPAAGDGSILVSIGPVNAMFNSTPGYSSAQTITSFINFVNSNFNSAGLNRVYVNQIDSTNIFMSGNIFGDSTLLFNLNIISQDHNQSMNVTPLNPLRLNLTSLIEGRYNSFLNTMEGDYTDIYIRDAVSPYEFRDTSILWLDSAGNGIAYFYNIINETSYYIVVKHKNSIETWSKAGGEMFTNSSLNYDFTTSASKAYGNNLILKATEYCMYSGDVNQDGIIDASDLGIIDNDASNFVTGEVLSDLNGDNIVDGTDYAIANNNAYNFVSLSSP